MTGKELAETCNCPPGVCFGTKRYCARLAGWLKPPESPQEPQSFLKASDGPDPLYFASSAPWERLYVRAVPQDIPARTILWPHDGQGIGIPCASCKVRGGVRVGPRVYVCQEPGCRSFSLVTIGRPDTDGFKTYVIDHPTEAEQAEAERRMSAL